MNTAISSAVAYYERVQELVSKRKVHITVGRRTFNEPCRVRARSPWKVVKPEKVEEIVRLLKAGYTQKKVGELVGCSQQKVGTVAIENGLGTGKGSYQRIRRLAAEQRGKKSA